MAKTADKKLTETRGRLRARDLAFAGGRGMQGRQCVSGKNRVAFVALRTFGDVRLFRGSDVLRLQLERRAPRASMRTVSE